MIHVLILGGRDSEYLEAVFEGPDDKTLDDMRQEFFGTEEEKALKLELDELKAQQTLASRWWYKNRKDKLENWNRKYGQRLNYLRDSAARFIIYIKARGFNRVAFDHMFRMGGLMQVFGNNDGFFGVLDWYRDTLDWSPYSFTTTIEQPKEIAHLCPHCGSLVYADGWDADKALRYLLSKGR